MAPTSPSPEPFGPTLDEYLATSTSTWFPVTFGDPNSTETQSPYASTSTSSGLSLSYPPSQRRLSPAPMRVTPIANKRKASSLPPPDPYPVMPPSPIMRYPVQVMRPTAIQTDLKTTTSSLPDTPRGTQVGRWTRKEHELFLEGLQRFGKSWKKISSLVHTRTLVQIRTHAQKYLQKQSRAAIKADARAAEAASVKVEPRLKTEQQQFQVDGAQQSQRAHSTRQVNASRIAVATSRQWTSPHPGEHNSGFAPLAFPISLSSSVSMTKNGSAVTSDSATSPSAAFQVNTVSRLDQLLQDDNSNTIPVFVDEYYTSPTAIEDDLLRPLYTNGSQWVPRLAPASYSNKRRRVETSISGCPTDPASTSIGVPELRPAFPGASFEPLPAPDNLSSPSTSPSASTQRQSAAAAALLAAHETDETNCTNVWL